MTIDTAIEILENYLRGIEPDDPDFALPTAWGLGVEALKRERERRFFYPSSQTVLLPGETEE